MRLCEEQAQHLVFDVGQNAWAGPEKIHHVKNTDIRHLGPSFTGELSQ